MRNGHWICDDITQQGEGRTVVRKRTELVPALKILRNSVSEFVDEFDLLYAQTGRTSGPSHFSKVTSKKIDHLNPALFNSTDSRKPQSQRENES